MKNILMLFYDAISNRKPEDCNAARLDFNF